tara:strand:+ start:154 stop:354 length:201 start_codon:yes stop_codon:yes gene_type:complete
MKQIPFRITFTLQSDELQKEYTEIFRAKSASDARAVALAGAGPNRIFIHSVGPAFDIILDNALGII